MHCSDPLQMGHVHQWIGLKYVVKKSKVDSVLLFPQSGFSTTHQTGPFVPSADVLTRDDSSGFFFFSCLKIFLILLDGKE